MSTTRGTGLKRGTRRDEGRLGGSSSGSSGFWTVDESGLVDEKRVFLGGRGN